MTNEISKTFCPVPWLHLSVDSDQSLRLCCHAVEDRSFKDDDGNTIYLNELAKRGSIANISHLKRIRKSFLEGNYPKNCEDCFQVERSGGRSPRLNKHRDLLSDLKQNTEPSGEVSSLNFRFFDISIGNICNLKCRMCSPAYSKAIAKDWDQLNLDYNKEALERGSWTIDKRMLDSIESIASNIEFIEIQGGEPQTNREVVQILEVFVQLGMAKKINIKVFTNLTTLNLGLLNLLMKFKAVSFMVSIEGIEQVNDYIRYPSKFNTLHSNLEKLKNLSKAFPLYITFNCVFQSYNALSVVDLIKYLRPYMPCFSFLHYPDFLSSQHLPLELKNVAKEKIDTFIEDFQPQGAQDEIGLNTLMACAERMMDSPRDLKSYGEFRKFTEQMDKMRKQKIFDTIPEFKNHWT